MKILPPTIDELSRYATTEAQLIWFGYLAFKEIAAVPNNN
jgi:hypothetical protein